MKDNKRALREYVCQLCENTFLTERDEQDALAEKECLFPGLGEEESALVCEDCFVDVMDYNEPGLKRYKKFLKIG